MSPMVTQFSTDLDSVLEDDFLQMIDPQVHDQTDPASYFEMIGDISEIFPEYDNTKLMENNGVNVDLPDPPCPVMVQPTSLDPVPDSTEILKYEPVSPEMIVRKLVSPQPSVESALSLYSSQSFTSDTDSVQPSKQELITVQPASLGQQYVVVYTPQPSSLEPVVQHAAPMEPVLSPYSVQLQEEAAPVHSSGDAPKKRGRKRKYPEGAAPSCTRPKKPKIYEMGPLPDEKAEKRRKNAINAKRHRDMQKNELNSLAQQLQIVTAERDSLQKQVQQMMQSNAQMKQMLANKEHQNIVLL